MDAFNRALQNHESRKVPRNDYGKKRIRHHSLIRESTKFKDGKKHRYLIVEYILLGKRKQVWRSDLAEAKAVASEACIKVANGDHKRAVATVV